MTENTSFFPAHVAIRDKHRIAERVQPGHLDNPPGNRLHLIGGKVRQPAYLDRALQPIAELLGRHSARDVHALRQHFFAVSGFFPAVSLA